MQEYLGMYVLYLHNNTRILHKSNMEHTCEFLKNTFMFC